MEAMRLRGVNFGPQRPLAPGPRQAHARPAVRGPMCTARRPQGWPLNPNDTAISSRTEAAPAPTRGLVADAGRLAAAARPDPDLGGALRSAHQACREADRDRPQRSAQASQASRARAAPEACSRTSAARSQSPSPARAQGRAQAGTDPETAAASASTCEASARAHLAHARAQSDRAASHCAARAANTRSKPHSGARKSSG